MGRVVAALRYLWEIIREAWAESVNFAQALVFILVISVGGGMTMFPHFSDAHGIKAILDQIASWEGAALALSAVVLTRVVFAPFNIHKRNRSEIKHLEVLLADHEKRNSMPAGRWHKNKFILDEPLAIHTCEVTAADNGRPQVFEVPFANPHSLVEFINDIDRR
jgi:hypothetical protein